MHEAHLMSGLLRSVEQAVLEAGGECRVVAVSVRMGALCHISPGHFREHFDRETVGTVAEKATLTLEVSTDTGDPLAQDIVLTSIVVED